MKNNDSFSKDHVRTMSIGSATPSNRRAISLRISMLNSSGKISNGHPGPGDLEDSKNFRMKKVLAVNELIEKITNEVSMGKYDQGLISVKKLLREDPGNLKGLHLRAQCYIGIKDFKQAIPDLLSIIQDHPGFSKHAYIEVATCFVEAKDFSTAVRQITRGLLKFPKFLEGYLSRGALYNQIEKWDKAINDFYEAISLGPTDGTGHLGLADSLIGIHEFKNACKMLDQALKFPNTRQQALLRRGKIFFETHEYEKALQDFGELIETEVHNAEAHYYKGFSLLGQNNVLDAAVALEQVIKYDEKKQFTGAAIYNLGAIKIKQRDFYGAYFTFQRAVELGVEIDEQKVLKGYVEAILCLMKRKFKEGVALLTKIIKKKHVLIQEYMGNCFAYRGYAYASLENHEKAVRDLANAKKSKELDYSSLYNLLISQSILCGDSENSLNLLEKAQELFPRNIEPLEYRAAIIFQLNCKKNHPEKVNIAKDLLDSAIKMRDSDSDLFFFRGILLYYLKRPIDAVYDLEKAIDKAEDNVPLHFLARGLCSAKLRMYKEAVQDFSIVIQLDEKVADAYLYRGRCNFLMENMEEALEDFQQYLALNPKDQDSHVYIGSLLMATGAFGQALSALNTSKSENTVSLHLNKAKCYALSGNIQSAIEELVKSNHILKTAQNNYDIEVLTLLFNLQNESNLSKVVTQITSIQQYKSEGNICKNLHLHWAKGLCYFYLGEFAKSYAEFASIVKKKNKKKSSMDRNNVEILYNLALCCIFSEKYEEASEYFHEIVYFTEEEDRGKILLLMGILNYALDRTKDAKTILTEAFKCDPDTVGEYLEEKPDVKILPLSSDSEYSKGFKFVKVSVGDSHPVLVRLSFTVPRPELASFEFGVEANILQSFSIKTVKCKPEIPWLNRVKGSIQFTDEIQHYETESITEEVEEKPEESGVFSGKSLRPYKSQEIRMRTLGEKENLSDSDSSLSEILDHIDELNF